MEEGGADSKISRQMRDIAIYGAGGLGREVACLINRINIVKPTWNLIGFFDDGRQKGEEVSHFGRILGGMNDLNDYTSGSLDIVLAFGNPRTIQAVHSNITTPNIFFPNLIDPTFDVEDTLTFRIGIGNIIKRDTSVTTNVSIGNFNLLNGGIRIGHDAMIGDYNVVMPGVRISGEVTIGNRNLFGAESFIKQQVKIDCDVTLSPVSALLTKPKNGFTYIGNPAKIFKV